MGQQFSEVNSTYGAPMGRREYRNPGDLAPRTVRLFRVRLDSGGYDDGGAYWGHGDPLYCATLTDEAQASGEFNDYREFTRARSRFDAAALLDIEPRTLAVPLKFDSRYTVQREFCGQTAARYVFRYLGEFVSHHAERDEAEQAALNHRREALASLSRA